ncbi:MAG: RNA polymerase subunit sigma-70, partial [Acidobacteriia bacterium]|nr:RNA polymerase subunit sigma-70 [Terriglobia bacterium]
MAAGVLREITGLLTAWGTGDESALNALMPMVYQELRVVARKHLASQPPGNSLESAVLVNEAYLKLLRADGIRCEGRLQFFALCAQIIRHILVDHSRNRRYAKRGGGAVQIPFDEGQFGSPIPVPGVAVLDLDRALTSLS